MRGLIGIQRVRLAMQSAFLMVGPVHFLDPKATLSQMSGQTSAVTPVALNTYRGNKTLASDERHEFSTSSTRGEELIVREMFAIGVDDPNVVCVGVGINADSDFNDFICHDEVVSLTHVQPRIDWVHVRQTKWADKTVMGLFVKLV